MEFIGHLLYIALGVAVGLLASYLYKYYAEHEKIWGYDQVETHEGCTVEILTSTKHDHQEICWYRGSSEELPIIHTPYED